MLERLREKILSLLRSRCSHRAAVADLMEGDGLWQVRWCPDCGAVQLAPHDGPALQVSGAGTLGRWRLGRWTWAEVEPLASFSEGSGGRFRPKAALPRIDVRVPPPPVKAPRAEVHP